MTTQMTSARRGVATDEMKKVAKDEDVTLDWLMPKIASGSIIIPSNNVRPQQIHNVGIGKGMKTKVNVNIGSSTLNVDVNEEIEKELIALEKEIRPPRPLTHDLFKNFSDCFEIKIKQVIIHKIVDGVFFSSLICVRDKIEEIIDSRTSDAIALAIRFDSPIFTYENVLDKAGILLKTGEIKKDKEKKSEENDLSKKIDYGKLSIIQLEKAISVAVKNEDYELAAHLRDEINKRK